MGRGEATHWGSPETHSRDQEGPPTYLPGRRTPNRLVKSRVPKTQHCSKVPGPLVTQAELSPPGTPGLVWAQGGKVSLGMRWPERQSLGAQGQRTKNIRPAKPGRAPGAHLTAPVYHSPGF